MKYMLLIARKGVSICYLRFLRSVLDDISENARVSFECQDGQRKKQRKATFVQSLRGAREALRQEFREPAYRQAGTINPAICNVI